MMHSKSTSPLFKIILWSFCSVILLSPAYAMNEEEDLQHPPVVTPKEKVFPLSPLPEGVHELSATELISHPRVQLFSILKTEGEEKAHFRLEEMRKEDQRISSYPALVVSEKRSKWLRGQIGPFANSKEAMEAALILRNIFTKDLPCASNPGVIHQQGFELEKAEKHIWE